MEADVNTAKTRTLWVSRHRDGIASAAARAVQHEDPTAVARRGRATRVRRAGQDGQLGLDEAAVPLAACPLCVEVTAGDAERARCGLGAEVHHARQRRRQKDILPEPS